MQRSKNGGSANDALPSMMHRQYLSSIQRFRSNYQDMPAVCSAYQPERHERALGLRRCRTLRKSTTPKRNLPETYLSTQEALWFMSLPDKIQRQCFTREERILLRAGCEIVLSASVASDTYANSTVSHASQLDWLELPRSIVSVDDVEEDTDNKGSSDWIRYDDVCDDVYDGRTPSQTSSSILSFEQCQGPIGIPSLHRERHRSSGTRNFSLPSSCTTDTDEESLRTTSWLSDGLCQEDRDSSANPTRFYHDPEARAKLRQVVATPKDFDQALSERETTFRLTLTRPSLRTMDEMNEVQNQDSVRFEDIPDEQSDPLALEPLPFSDDTTGMHGHFAAAAGEEKGVRRIWKLMNRKPVMWQ